MIYQVFVKDISLKVNIGLCELERSKPQIILCDIRLKVSMPESELDNINFTVNYYDLTKMLQLKSLETRFMLLEALADFLLDYILSHQVVQSAKIRLTKPDIMQDVGAGACGVELERSCP